MQIYNSYGIDDIHAERDDIQSHSALMIYQVCDLDVDTPLLLPCGKESLEDIRLCLKPERKRVLRI